MDIEKRFVTESFEDVAIAPARDFLDPAFEPTPPFGSPEEMGEDFRDDTRRQADTPAA